LKIGLVGDAIDEIRSELDVILGSWEVISERLCEVGDPSVAAWMAAVERAGSRLVGTVHDILDFSRLASGAVQIRTEALRVTPLIEAVVRGAAPVAAAKKIGLSCVIDVPDPLGAG